MLSGSDSHTHSYVHVHVCIVISQKYIQTYTENKAERSVTLEGKRFVRCSIYSFCCCCCFLISHTLLFSCFYKILRAAFGITRNLWRSSGWNKGTEEIRPRDSGVESKLKKKEGASEGQKKTKQI